MGMNFGVYYMIRNNISNSYFIGVSLGDLGG